MTTTLISKSQQQVNRADVNVVVCDGRASARNTVRDCLRQFGFQTFTMLNNFEALEMHLRYKMPDLVVTDIALEDGDVCMMTKAMRSGMFGNNPFTPIIVTSWHGEQDILRKAINAGVDDILINPISPKALMTRIDALVNARKPFIVTSDYIGPERRKDPSRVSTIPYITPPNPLRAKVMGETLDPADLADEIEQARGEVRDEKLRRVGFQISFLVGLVLPALETGGISDEIRRHVDNLETMADEAVARLKGSPYESATDLCHSMANVASAINRDPDNPTKKDLELLEPLSAAILKTLYPDDDETSLASQITNAIGTYTARRRA